MVVAASEMAIAGRLGLVLNISNLHENPAVALFAETNGCFLVEINSQNIAAFENKFSVGAEDQKPLFLHIGSVTTKKFIKISHGQSTIINLPLSDLIKAFKGPNS